MNTEQSLQNMAPRTPCVESGIDAQRPDLVAYVMRGWELMGVSANRNGAESDTPLPPEAPRSARAENRGRFRPSRGGPSVRVPAPWKIRGFLVGQQNSRPKSSNCPSVLCSSSPLCQSGGRPCTPIPVAYRGKRTTASRPPLEYCALVATGRPQILAFLRTCPG